MVSFFNKLFKKQINSITIAAIMVAGSTLVSRMLGIFRDRILAGEFGAGDTLDIYYASFRIPDLIFNLIVLGALSAGFIPVFTQLVKDHKNTSKNKEAWALANNALNILGITLAVLSVLAIIFAPKLIILVAPGFSLEKKKMVIELSRIMFLSPLLLGISSIFGGVLQSLKRFFVYSLSPIFYNVGIIIGALFFVPRFGIYGLAWGVVFGAAMHLLVQLPLIFKLGYRYSFKIDFKNINIRTIGRMMVPRTMSLAIAQIDLLVSTSVASTLAAGSLAIFNFANNLQNFPVGIFAISYAVAAFPALSASKNDKKLAENFSSTARNILFFMIPAAILLYVLRAQIVRVVLGTGNFSWEATVLTINTLGFFCIGLFAQGLIPLLVRSFYAKHNSRTPFYIGMFSVLINIVLCLSLPKLVFCSITPAGKQFCSPLGVEGLALAYSISATVNMLLLWYALRRMVGGLDGKRIVWSLGKFIIAGAIAGLATQLVKFELGQIVAMQRFLGVFSQGVLAGCIGILIYIGACKIMKSEELSVFWESFKRRIPGFKTAAPDDQGEARGI